MYWRLLRLVDQSHYRVVAAAGTDYFRQLSPRVQVGGVGLFQDVVLIVLGGIGQVARLGVEEVLVLVVVVDLVVDLLVLEEVLDAILRNVIFSSVCRREDLQERTLASIAWFG